MKTAREIQLIRREIGDAVRNQFSRLPAGLQHKWTHPTFLEIDWFKLASQYIEIPHPEYW